MGSIIFMLFSIGDAPFCVVTNTERMCLYYDVASCKQDADRMSGFCERNQ